MGIFESRLGTLFKKDGRSFEEKRLELINNLIADLKEAQALSAFNSCPEAKTFYEVLERTKKNLSDSADQLYRDPEKDFSKLATRILGRAEGIAMAQALMKVSLAEISKLEEKIKKMREKQKDKPIDPAFSRLR